MVKPVLRKLFYEAIISYAILKVTVNTDSVKGIKVKEFGTTKKMKLQRCGINKYEPKENQSYCDKDFNFHLNYEKGCHWFSWEQDLTNLNSK